MLALIYVWYMSPVKLDFCFLGDFFFYHKFSFTTVIGLFRLPISVSGLEDGMFLEIYSFLLGCLIYWHITVYSNLSFLFLLYWLLCLLFHFLFSLSPLYFNAPH